MLHVNYIAKKYYDWLCALEDWAGEKVFATYRVTSRFESWLLPGL